MEYTPRFAPFANTDAEATKSFRSYCRGRPIIMDAIGAHDSTHIAISMGAAIGLMTSGAGFMAMRMPSGTVLVYPA